jgi:hypothetical protein
MVLTRRCERLATAVSSARQPSEWPQLLGPAAVPVVDRLVRRARMLKFAAMPLAGAVIRRQGRNPHSFFTPP